MKKLIFGLLATVLFGFSANAQLRSKEEVRISLAKSMISFKNSLQSNYDSSRDYKGFKDLIHIPTTIPTEGENLLRVAYNYLSKKTSDAEIIKNYSGKEMAAACLYIHTNTLKNKDFFEGKLFGLNYDDSSYMIKSTSKGPNPSNEIIDFNVGCKWYQIRCWANEIFGEEAGGAIVTAIVNFLISLL